MATTESNGVSECTCPLCGDYTGQPSSVEAHISRMTDPQHQGEVGRAYRDGLHHGVDETSDVESSDDQGDVSTDDFRQGGGLRSPDTDTEVEDGQDGSMVSDDELGRQREQFEQDSDDEDDDLEVTPVEEEAPSAGIPIPVSSTVLIGGVAALVLVVVWFRVRQSSSSEPEDEQQSEQQGQQRPPSSGLSGEY